MTNTNEFDEYEQIIVAVKELTNNSKEIVYKHLKKNINEKIKKLQEIKDRLENDKFEMPMSKRKRDKETISEKFLEKDLEKLKDIDNEVSVLDTISATESNKIHDDKMKNQHSSISKSSPINEMDLSLDIPGNYGNPFIPHKTEIYREIFAEYFETDDEEYDPNQPNDYEKMTAEIKNKQKQEKLRAKAKKKLAAELERKKQKQTKNSSLIDKLIQEKDQISIKNSIVVSENIRIVETENRNKNDEVNLARDKQPKSQDKAKKMLEKMGWTGQGLGKYEQGIVTPLMVKKTGERYGIIINANTNISQPEVDIKNFFNRTPTKILLITNIVSKNEINEEIYHEIRAECENYGIVEDVKFFEFNYDDLPAGELVRVFVEYDSVESAIKAFGKLYDRYFSERIIRVKFYDEQLYYNNILDSFNYGNSTDLN